MVYYVKVNRSYWYKVWQSTDFGTTILTVKATHTIHLQCCDWLGDYRERESLTKLHINTSDTVHTN